jgi:UDP-N-acetyl-D-mannosaminouronate:lipid I N-acetyl-D-mannosaminouronosyltransferase
MLVEQITINDFRCYVPASRAEFIGFIAGIKGILVALNAEKIARHDQDLVALTQDHVGYPDGFGAVLCCRQKGATNAIKIPGCELWLELIEHFCETKTFYVLGSDSRTLNAAMTKLIKIFPHVKIVGSQHGYFDPSLEHDVINTVVRAAPDIVFVAMGSPRQEFLMEKMFVQHPAIYQGLGGSLDVFVGNLSRAPKVWEQLNLEWLYRLVTQPQRIMRQTNLLKFFLFWALRKY